MPAAAPVLTSPKTVASGGRYVVAMDAVGVSTPTVASPRLAGNPKVHKHVSLLIDAFCGLL